MASHFTIRILPILLVISAINTAIVNAVTEGEFNLMLTALRARGYHLFANAITTTDLRYDIISDGTNFTFFAPIDSALFELDMTIDASDYVTTLRFHVVPRRMSLADILRLPSAAHSVPTLMPGYEIMIEQSLWPRSSITVDGVDILVPGLFYGRDIAVHGLQGILGFRSQRRNAHSNVSGNHTSRSRVRNNHTTRTPMAPHPPISNSTEATPPPAANSTEAPPPPAVNLTQTPPPPSSRSTLAPPHPPASNSTKGGNLTPDFDSAKRPPSPSPSNLTMVSPPLASNSTMARPPPPASHSTMVPPPPATNSTMPRPPPPASNSTMVASNSTTVPPPPPASNSTMATPPPPASNSTMAASPPPATNSTGNDTLTISVADLKTSVVSSADASPARHRISMPLASRNYRPASHSASTAHTREDGMSRAQLFELSSQDTNHLSSATDQRRSAVLKEIIPVDDKASACALTDDDDDDRLKIANIRHSYLHARELYTASTMTCAQN